MRGWARARTSEPSAARAPAPGWSITLPPSTRVEGCGTRGSGHAPACAAAVALGVRRDVLAYLGAGEAPNQTWSPACSGSFARLVLARPAASALLATPGREIFSAGRWRRAVREPGADCVIHVRAGRLGAVPRGRGKVSGSRGLHKDVAWAS